MNIFNFFLITFIFLFSIFILNKNKYYSNLIKYQKKIGIDINNKYILSS